MSEGELPFSRAIALRELRPGRPARVQTERGAALIVSAGGDIFALSPLCPHQLGDLSQGDVVSRGAACEIDCPIHGYRFDLRTGACLHPREDYRLRLFDVKVEDGWVHVRIPRPKWMDD